MTGIINPALFGMPDATTTGPQAGVTLTPYTGSMIVTTPGAVIENVIINGQLTVNAANVTIKNCIIQSNGWWGIEGDQAPNLTVENSKIIGGNLTNSGILGSGTFVGNDISHVSIGIQLTGGATVSSNYIHDLFYGSADPHYDGVTALGGQNHVVIEHNTIIAPDNNGTADVFIDNDFGSVNDVTVKDNLMLGGAAYTVHVDQKTGQSGTITNVAIENNYLERGYYGYISDNSHATILNNVQWNNNSDPTPYPTSLPSSPSSPSSPTQPSAPTIASFSPDTGVVGDGITDANTLDLKGTAAAGSTVKIYDGSTQIGSTTATSTGSWDYITSVLTDAKHTLTATATNSSGQTSAASAALAVTVDTKAPAAPTIASDTVNSANQVVASGNAEANSTIKVYDGTTQVGTATTNASGAWTVTTTALAAGTHGLTATATDAAGNVSAASQPFDPVIGGGSTTPPTTGGASTGSGLTGLVQVGNNYFLGSTGPELKYHGAAVTAGQFQDWIPISSVQVAGGGYDVAWKNSSGQFTFWATDGQGNFQSYPTNGVALAGNSSTVESYETIFQQDLNGDHTIGIPGATSGSGTSASTGTSGTGTSGTGTSGTVDTTAPDAPVLLSDATYHHRATVTGTAEAGSTVNLYEGTTLLGTATTGADGHFSVTTSGLKDGSHTFVATATDAAGNTSAVSQPIDPPIGSHSATGTSTTGTSTTGTSTIDVTNVHQHRDHTATINGTADANSQIKLSDGTASAGSVTAGADGKWSFHTSDLSGKAHAFTAEQVDTTGHVVGTSSGEAIVGSRQGETLTGTTGNDVMVGKGGADTFVFASNFGHDVIKDLATGGPAHDAIQFSKSVFDSFASVLSHAAQSGHDVVIATGSDTLTLKNTKVDALNSHDFHFA